MNPSDIKEDDKNKLKKELPGSAAIYLADTAANGLEGSRLIEGSAVEGPLGGATQGLANEGLVKPLENGAMSGPEMPGAEMASAEVDASKTDKDADKDIEDVEAESKEILEAAKTTDSSQLNDGSELKKQTPISAGLNPEAGAPVSNEAAARNLETVLGNILESGQPGAGLDAAGIQDALGELSKDQEL